MRMWVVKPSFVNFEVLSAAINEIPKTMGRKNHSYYPGNFKGSRGDHCPEEWAARQSERQLKKGLWPLRQVIYYDECKVGCIIENAEKSAVTHSQHSTGVRSTIDLKKKPCHCVLGGDIDWASCRRRGATCCSPSVSRRRHTPESSEGWGPSRLST